MILTTLEEVAATIGPLMNGFRAPWCVAGGWAVDLWLGRRTRDHSDLELATFRHDQARLRSHLSGWSFEVRVDGRSEAWHGERLELPLHEIHAHSPDEPRRSIEFLLNERDAANWVFRRDPRIVLPLDEAICATEYGIDALAPEIVLLFKAKAPRDKDEVDFRSAVAALSEKQRGWLQQALLAIDPGHAWLTDL